MKIAQLLLAVGIYSAQGLQISRTDDVWKFNRQVDSEESVTSLVALRQQNLEWLEETFWQVSDPDHPDYGKFLSREEISNKVGASQESIDLVTAWLEENGAEVELLATGDALEISMTSAAVENMFNVEMHVYEHSETKEEFRRPNGKLSVPDHVMPHIDFFSGGITQVPVSWLHRQPRVSNGKVASKRSTLSSSGRRLALDGDHQVIPSTVNKLYNITADYHVTIISNDTQNWTNKMAVAAFDLGQETLGATYEDLVFFDNKVGEPVADQFEIVGEYLENAEKCSQVGNDEQTLDMQYMTSVGRGVDTAYYTATGWVYDYAVLAQTNFDNSSGPWVHSLSYGLSENLQGLLSGGGDASVYIARSNVEFQKLAVMGVSVLVSSGDGGATNWDRDTRISGSPAYGSASCDDYPNFSAQFPTSSPYVTSVGATNWKDSDEVACSTANGALITTGGGFSGYSDRGSYQADVVDAWAANADNNLPPTSMFNVSKRAYPDVSMFGHSFKICKKMYLSCQYCFFGDCDLGSDEGTFVCEAVDGTSASAPSFAGMVGLINEARLAAGTTPLGFLNPLLYKMHAEAPEVFFDVTSGDNKCTEQNAGCCPYGYEAAVGWDPVSGLGTPNFGMMLSYMGVGSVDSPADDGDDDDDSYKIWYIIGGAVVGCMVVIALVATAVKRSRGENNGQPRSGHNEPLLVS